MDAQNKIIGGGIIFPIEINEQGRVNIYSGITIIRASILHILNWPIAHRYFNERFGCRIEECLEEPVDGITQTLIRRFIIDALGKWERRITVGKIKMVISEDNTRIDVLLHYTVNKTLQTDVFVFPFYNTINY